MTCSNWSGQKVTTLASMCLEAYALCYGITQYFLFLTKCIIKKQNNCISWVENGSTSQLLTSISPGKANTDRVDLLGLIVMKCICMFKNNTCYKNVNIALKTWLTFMKEGYLFPVIPSTFIKSSNCKINRT